MKNLEVKGNQIFLGVNIPVIEGGFGEGQKVILAKTIAEIHEVELKRINELIGNNIDEFETGVDLLDLCTDDFKVVAKDLGFITSNGQKHCYLLSEQGYMLLVGFMKTQKAKEIRKKLRREYFAMREIINNNDKLKADLLLSIYNGGQEGILATKQLVELEKKPLIDKIESDEPKVNGYDIFINTDGLMSLGEFAKSIGYGRNKFIELLKENKILMENRLPYQKFMKYFNIKVTDKNGIEFKSSLVNKKGVEYLTKKFGNK